MSSTHLTPVEVHVTRLLEYDDRGRVRRKLRSVSRVLRDAGLDPFEPRPVGVPVPTFAKAAEALLASASPFLAPQTVAQRRRSLALHVYPRLGPLPVTDIEPCHVVEVLEAVRVRAPRSVDRVRQRIAHVTSWMVACGVRPDDPCGPALAALMPPRSSPRRSRPALPYADVPDAVASVRDSDAWVGTRLLFEFVVLTVVRPGDARAACWSEVDLETAVWTVPAERSATRRPHRVPLSSAALAVLGEARDHRSLCEARLRGECPDLLFPSVRGRVLSSGALSTMLNELGIRAVPFGFRHTFLAWAAEMGVETRIARACLSHDVICGSVAMLIRPDFYRHRVPVMRQWGHHVAPGRSATVSPTQPLVMDSKVTHLSRPAVSAGA